MAVQDEYIFNTFAFTLGPAGAFITFFIILLPDWRLLYTKNNTMYMTGYTQVGLWKMCFPPNIKGPDDYSIRCCHRFATFEKFFPVEMKVGQVLLPIAFCLAFVGLLFSYLTQEWRSITRKQARWFFIIGGILYVLSSICILVPISWNTYSVAQNKLIPFPPSFHLPTPVRQRNGPAVIAGYISTIFLFTSGSYIVVKSFITPDTILPIILIRVMPI